MFIIFLFKLLFIYFHLSWGFGIFQYFNLFYLN